MKKIAALIGLILALLVGAVPSVHADVVPPDSPCWLMIGTINNVQVTTYEYSVTQLTFSDGTVRTLNTSDGSSYTLDFSTDGTFGFITKYNPDGSVDAQWVFGTD